MARVIGITRNKDNTGRSAAATNLSGKMSARKDIEAIGFGLPQDTSASWCAFQRPARDLGAE